MPPPIGPTRSEGLEFRGHLPEKRVRHCLVVSFRIADSAQQTKMEEHVMIPKKLVDDISVSPQISVSDVETAKEQGFRSILVNRPDGEEPGQPTFAEITAAATAIGMSTRHVPIEPGKQTPADVSSFAKAVQDLPKPILGYCRTGTRTATLWSLANDGNLPRQEILGLTQAAGYDVSKALQQSAAVPADHDGKAGAIHDVVVVGAGAGGLAAAASMIARVPDLDIVVIDPADVHYYQPGWTLVGAGVFRPEQTKRDMATLIPKGVKWIKAAVTEFRPDDNTVVVEGKGSIRYRKLVVAPGIRLNWAAIEGLEETLGRNGVTSNYRYDLAQYTWKLVQNLNGGEALFTQPPMPIKCAGAPQKAMYLSCDHWRGAGRLDRTHVEFLNAGPVLFGVADYVPPLMEYVRKYRIDLSFGHTLFKVDGATKTAWFRKTDKDGASEIVERRFDMLHVVPPQTAPDFIKNSPLANEAGWVEVDPASLRHVRYPDIYGLGDATSTTNAKTAAAARKQAPVVAENLLRDIGRLATDQTAIYDGYGSCPLTVERGKVILAEFAYGGKRVPSFPKWFIDDLKPSKAAWLLKERMLPQIYWQGMLKGREPMAKPVHAPATSEA